ncbi:hypothetical protein GCM10011428_15200 [Streptomyces violaceus]
MGGWASTWRKRIRRLSPNAGPTRIGEFLARGMLEWLWREDCFAPWALDLAMRYIDRNVAVAEATRLLTEAAEAGKQWRPTADGRPCPP